LTIEFSCSHCNKVLKTSDDKAGRRAKCPQCGEPIDVPQPADDQGFDGFDEFDESVPEEESFLAGGTTREEDSFLSGGSIDCPMCGAPVPAGAQKCQACGEALKASRRSGRGHWEPRVFSIGAVLSRAWEVYKANLGMVLAVPLLAGGIYFVASIVIGIASAVIGAVLAGGVGNDVAPLVQIPVALVQNLIIYSIFFYLQLGGQLVFLQIVRGESPDLSVMFNGGPFFWRMFLCSMIYGILIFVGMILLIIPGIVVALMFWPFSFILIDRNLPGIESFSESRKVTSGNLLNLLGLSLALGGISILGGIVTLGIGLIFIMPFTYMAQTVAYAEMTSQ
tara:strand:- start:3310 stop:4317 length:1008 start_codon:yes stop_codon:yes gene_type:complete